MSRPAGLLPDPLAVDIVPFGECVPWSEGETGGLMVEWAETREVQTVIVTFNDDSPPNPERVRVEYWYSNWPSPRGGGWMRLDDRWNGRWLTVHADVEVAGPHMAFRFRPLSDAEHPQTHGKIFPYRRTLKVRVVVDRGAPSAIQAFAVYGSSRWREADLLVEWGCLAEDRENWDGCAQADNGQILSIESASEHTQITGSYSWSSMVDGAPEAVRLHVRYADNPDRCNFDRGAITVRTQARGFSFFVDDVVREGAIFIRDVGAFISADGRRYRHWSAPNPPHWPRTILEETALLPEQSMERALERIPAKPPKAWPIGVPGGRQEFFSEPNGGLSLFRTSLRTDGPDTARRGWDDGRLYFTLAGGREPQLLPDRRTPATRWIEDGRLPLVHAEWHEGGVTYHHAAVATVLHGRIDDEAQRTGAEPLVWLGTVTLTNAGPETVDAFLWIGITALSGCVLEPNGVLRLPQGAAQTGPDRILAQIVVGRGQLSVCADPCPGVIEAVRYVVTLPPGGTDTLELKVPYLEILDKKDVERLALVSFKDQAPDVLAFWRMTLAQGMQIETPDRLLNDFYCANLWHVLVSADKDPATGLLMAHAGTVQYDVFANETCMIARSLEMRGLHDLAAAYLEPFFRYQGTKPLPGRFQSQDDVFYAAGEYTHLPYNMHHGFVLWAAAEHYRWTGDRQYIEARQDALLRGCDWIIRERQATMKEANGRRVPEYGLAPAGQLEDIAEFQYWYATNAYYYLGLSSVAEVFTELGHPHAERLLREAAAYREDIRASAREMLVRTPVVRLLDGTYVPYLPARVYARTHLTEGWIREALYCSLHLLDAGVFRPDEEEVGWILQDLEDNIFVRPESGFPLDCLETQWFDWGGFTLQPTLLFNSIAYLRRGEVRAFLRSFYNTFVASFYPDGRCFAEYMTKPGEGGGPLFKPPDECKFVQWLRLALVLEEGRDLWVAAGVPRRWLADGRRVRLRAAKTLFGEIDLDVHSAVYDGQITVRLQRRAGREPDQIHVRVPHPCQHPPKRVRVNGAFWETWDGRTERVTLPGSLDSVEMVVEYR